MRRRDRIGGSTRAGDEFRIFDGQPTRLYFTGNPHHPTFGREKLAKLLDRHFDGKSPIVVDGRPVPDWCQDEMNSLNRKALASGR